jgi:hypothetical protein
MKNLTSCIEHAERWGRADLPVDAPIADKIFDWECRYGCREKLAAAHRVSARVNDTPSSTAYASG